jgi:hypothetical protein
LKKKKEEEAKAEEDFCCCRASALFGYSFGQYFAGVEGGEAAVGEEERGGGQG